MNAYDFFLAVFNYLTRFPTVIIVAELAVCFYYPKKKYFLPRLLPNLALYGVFAPMLLDNLTLFAVGPGGWFSFVYAIIFVWSVAVIAFCFSVRFGRALLCGLSGYIFQNTYYYIRALLDFAFPGGRDLLYFALSFIILVCMLFLFYVIFVRHFRTVDSSPRKIRNVLIYSGVVFVVVYVMHAWATYALEMNFSLYIFGIMLNLMLFVVQFDMFERSRWQADGETVERLLAAAEQQRSLSEENIAVINRKCHDLKYQIAAIRESGSADIAGELRELENAVNIYDHTANTGNKTLDAVLTEKKFVCDRYGIKFNYIADASRLGCIKSVVDLYSLFGNLIDNAIEGVKDLPEEKRIITLNVGGVGDMLRVHADNRCDAEPEFEDGLPKTSKDERYHGFGVKSIRYIAEKYGGNVVMRVENRRFITDIMIPYAD